LVENPPNQLLAIQTRNIKHTVLTGEPDLAEDELDCTFEVATAVDCVTGTALVVGIRGAVAAEVPADPEDVDR
jgi:hypothetical protein